MEVTTLQKFFMSSLVDTDSNTIFCTFTTYQRYISGKIFPANKLKEKNSRKMTPLSKVIRVGLIWSTLRYQFWSGTSERTISEDSKNVFEISVAIIQTHHGPLKATASTL